MPGFPQDFVDTVPHSRGDFAMPRMPNDPADVGETADGDYAWRLGWTLLVLAFYIGALALPAAGFIGVNDSSPVFILRPWALVPGQVETGWSMLFGGFIELVLGQIGAAGCIANFLFAIALFRFWIPRGWGFQARTMSSLAMGLAVVSLPLTNLAPILANEAGSKMAALAPLSGYWLWMASMALLWAAIRIVPPRKPNLVKTFSSRRMRRFALIEKAGGAELPDKAALTWVERIQIRLNVWALIFGAGYYIAKGMWKKGLALGILEMLVVGTLVTMAPSWHWITWLVQGGFVLFFGVSANLDFYNLTHGKTGVPKLKIRVLAFVFMMLFGWIATLTINYFSVHAAGSIALPATQFPRMQPDESEKSSSRTGQTSQETMKQKGVRPRPSSPHPLMALPSLPAPRQSATAALGSLPFHVGESVSEVRRTVASLPLKSLTPSS
ncbi:MAG: DUF2628 domain-containing protein [Thiomonas sp.]|jgi:hypothetical protein|nr:DUF2628 domain-containing protein [Thiomonas sp.]